MDNKLKLFIPFFLLIFLSSFLSSTIVVGRIDGVDRAAASSVTVLTGNLTKFTDLTDTPNTFVGDGSKCVRVNAGETALEFVACAGGGDFSFSNFQASFNLNTSGLQNRVNASYLTTYNTTYATYSSFNTTYNIQQLLNGTNLNLSIITGISKLCNSTGSCFTLTELNTSGGSSVVIWDATFNDSYLDRGLKAGFNETYNLTYATYSSFNTTYNIGVLYNLTASMIANLTNWTRITFDAYNATWSSQPTGSGVVIWDSTFNSSFRDLGIKESFNYTFNKTYDSFTTNVSKNWTEITVNAFNFTKIVFDLWNATWDESSGVLPVLWDSIFNTSFIDLGLKSGFNETFNSTYHNYATNVSKNWTEITNTTFNGIYTTTFNITYDKFTYNVSLNYTEIVFNAYDSKWEDSGAIIWDSIFNNSYRDLGLKSGFNETYNSTYATYITINSTKNIQELLNNTGLNLTNILGINRVCNTTGSCFTLTELNTSGGSSVVIWDNIFNDSYRDRGIKSGFNETYNLTYHNYVTNVSLNETERAYNLINGTNLTLQDQILFELGGIIRSITNWITINVGMIIGGDVNVTGDLNVSGDINLRNTNISTWAYNVSLNYSEIVFDTWDTKWEDSGAIIWDATFNSSFRDLGIKESFNYTFNKTYDSFTLNVSINYTKTVFDVWNSTWDESGSLVIWDTTFNNSYRDLGIKSGFNETYNLTYATYLSFNTTLNQQNLLNNSELALRNLNVTTNITTQGVNFETDVVNHAIYDNSTCIIIVAGTTQLEICE